MAENSKVTTMAVPVYFAILARGLRWYNYEELKKLVDLRQSTRAIGHVPIRLAILLAKDAEDMGLAA
jgi:hypothetical protein